VCAMRHVANSDCGTRGELS